ncbi:MAG: DUF4388 domain-containing protein, partial [Candidatus Obscuribacterales bacterium]|nr:DUF4388 domain-containing protein [Candidatus Obscuribacterales bacterium]
MSWLSDCRESYMLEHDLDSVKQVMLPWLHGAQKQVYAIGIGISKKQTGTSPVWTFYKAMEPEPQVEWAYSSSDVALIHNMLLCFFPDAKFTTESPDPCVYLPSPRREPEAKSDRRVADVPAEEPFLQGSIEKLPLDCLLQSLASSRVTGKLILSHREQNSGIYFDDGVPVHCFLDEEEGHDALLQLLTWKAGDFDVFSNERTSKKSITRRMESLLMESAVLVDYSEFLADNGIDDHTVLEKIPMSYREYLERMKDAPPLDQELLSLIAVQLDTSITIGELASKLGLSRPAWVPAIYAFVKSGVVRIGSANRSIREEQQLL